VYGDRTVCSCRHSKASAWVRSIYCVLYIWDFAEKWQSCTKPICTKLKIWCVFIWLICIFSQTQLCWHWFVRHLVCSVRYSVVLINYTLLTITLYFSVRTTLVYKNHKMFSSFHDTTLKFISRLTVLYKHSIHHFFTVWKYEWQYFVITI
jgi:hypothetical protein